MNNKYETIKSLLQNGDICEFKAWDSKIYFAFYMDGYFYKKQENGVVVAIGGYESNIVAIRRSECLRNAFQCFLDGNIYNYDYGKYGAFKTIYDEDNKKETNKQLRDEFLKWLKNKRESFYGLQDVYINKDDKVSQEKRIGTEIHIHTGDWLDFCRETGRDYQAVRLIVLT